MSDKFVRIKKDNQIYYGGDQKWFSKTRNQKMGCGIIAAANLIMSIQAKADKRYTGIDDDYLTIASWGRKLYINKNEFMMYVGKYSNFLFSNILVTKTNRATSPYMRRGSEYHHRVWSE